MLPKGTGWFTRGQSRSDATLLAIGQSRLALGKKAAAVRATAVTLVWVIHILAAWGLQSPAWQHTLPQWHLYLLVSWGLLLTHRVESLARRSVWLVPLLDMPMLFWIESIHSPLGNPPAEVVGYTAAGFVILVMWTALALDARFTMLSAGFAGTLQATLSYQNGANVLGLLISMSLMLVTGVMTVVITQLLATAMADVVEARIKKEEALRSSEEKDRFISTVTHDFRTPLSVLLAALQSLGDDAHLTDELRSDILARALRQCRKMMLMTEELLRLAQLGARAPDLAFVDLAALARETVRTLLPQAEKKGTELKGPSAHTVVRAWVDSSLLERALLNLVDNAVKYGGPQVEVRVVETEEGVRLNVNDNGQGIAEAELDRIFEPFHRAAPDKHGSGLGLAIVKEVAHIHGGRAQVSSALGQGTSFELALPRHGPA